MFCSLADRQGSTMLQDFVGTNWIKVLNFGKTIGDVHTLILVSVRSRYYWFLITKVKAVALVLTFPARNLDQTNKQHTCFSKWSLNLRLLHWSWPFQPVTQIKQTNIQRNTCFEFGLITKVEAAALALTLPAWSLDQTNTPDFLDWSLKLRLLPSSKIFPACTSDQTNKQMNMHTCFVFRKITKVEAAALASTFPQ
jgi:hypothetical protein